VPESAPIRIIGNGEEYPKSEVKPRSSPRNVINGHRTAFDSAEASSLSRMLNCKVVSAFIFTFLSFLPILRFYFYYKGQALRKLLKGKGDKWEVLYKKEPLQRGLTKRKIYDIMQIRKGDQ